MPSTTMTARAIAQHKGPIYCYVQAVFGDVRVYKGNFLQHTRPTDIFTVYRYEGSDALHIENAVRTHYNPMGSAGEKGTQRP